ncbi:MAG: hypothetical protein ACLQA5_01640 [Solirubrobacteraceae bacterium]
MTRSVTASKVLLVADRRTPPSSRDAAPVRRYRIARLRFDPPSAAGASRFEHLKRTYD